MSWWEKNIRISLSVLFSPSFLVKSLLLSWGRPNYLSVQKSKKLPIRDIEYCCVWWPSLKKPSKFNIHVFQIEMPSFYHTDLNGLNCPIIIMVSNQKKFFINYDQSLLICNTVLSRLIHSNISQGIDTMV